MKHNIYALHLIRKEVAGVDTVNTTRRTLTLETTFRAHTVSEYFTDMFCINILQHTTYIY